MLPEGARSLAEKMVMSYLPPPKPMKVRENEMCEYTGTLRKVTDGALEDGELKLSWHQANKLKGVPPEKVPLAFARMVRRLQRVHMKGGNHLSLTTRTRRGRPGGLTHREWKIQQLAAAVIFASNASRVCVV